MKLQLYVITPTKIEKQWYYLINLDNSTLKGMVNLFASMK